MASGKNEALLISVLNLRRVVGYIGIFLPSTLVLISGLVRRPTISEYYYSGAGDVFVGAMCAVGMFLCCYRGYDDKDFWVTSLAGGAAILLALFPTDPSFQPWSTLHGILHWFFAATFLSSLAYMSLFQFTQTNPKKKPTLQKLNRNRVYHWCGGIMVACLLLILVCKFVWKWTPGRPDSFGPVFCLEDLAVVSFGVSWLVKGETLFRDEKK